MLLSLSQVSGRRDLLLTFILHILTRGAICCQVSQQGDVLYVLPANFRAILRSRSWLLRLEPALAAARSAGAYLVRVSFGTALIASVLLVALSVVALLTAASSSDRDNRRCVTPDKTAVHATADTTHLAHVVQHSMHIYLAARMDHVHVCGWWHICKRKSIYTRNSLKMCQDMLGVQERRRQLQPRVFCGRGRLQQRLLPLAF